MNKQEALKKMRQYKVNTNLAVFDGDEYLMLLNEQFLIQNNAIDNLDLIKEAFILKFRMFKEMKKTRHKGKIRQIAEELHCHEFIIQDLFNFPMDINFHRFWEFPKCHCRGVMDNKERLGVGYFVYDSDCPIHGWE